MTNPRWDVLGIGTIAVDDLLLVAQYPLPDSKVDILESYRQGGGQTATAMVAAARQGARTAFGCRLGYDNLSLFSIAEMEREGVDCTPCHQDAEGSPYHSIIIVSLEEGTRTILHSGGKLALPLHTITPELISQARLLYVDDNGGEAGIKAAGIARSLNIPVIADVEPNPPPDVNRLLPLIDHLVIGRELGATLSGQSNEADMAAALCTDNRTCCIITAGEDGCWYSENGIAGVHVAGFRVEVVDTTGCGDVFHGAYTAAILRGECIADAVEIANASAAIKATRPGGRLGIPDLATVRQFIRKSNRTPIKG